MAAEGPAGGAFLHHTPHASYAVGMNGGGRRALCACQRQKSTDQRPAAGLRHSDRCATRMSCPSPDSLTAQPARFPFFFRNGATRPYGKRGVPARSVWPSGLSAFGTRKARAARALPPPRSSRPFASLRLAGTPRWPPRRAAARTRGLLPPQLDQPGLSRFALRLAQLPRAAPPHHRYRKRRFLHESGLLMISRRLHQSPPKDSSNA